MDEYSDAQLEALAHDWEWWGFDNQLEPPGDWQVWLFRAGRGAGKTRAGAEWIRENIKRGHGWAGLIAPTASDARDVMVEGESGLLSVCWEKDRDHKGNEMGRPHYEPSKRRVTWENGATAVLFSAEEPDRLRGPQHSIIWADELAAWKYCRDTWDNAMFGLRLGTNPRAMVTTTPKPVSVLREIQDDPGTVVSTGSTYDNAANLPKVFLDRILKKYEGTRTGRQEIHAELLAEAEGALWTRDMLERAHTALPPKFKRVVVAIDPATTKHEASSETGIIAAGLGEDDKGYLIKDVSGRFSPGEWAKKAIELYNETGADRFVAEGNQGGDMVRHTIETEWKGAPITIVHAHRGKQARAEPVAALYEQGRVKHMAGLDKLEDQMVNWEPLTGQESPDRLDAAVWALTDLMVQSAPQHEFWVA